MSGTGGARVWYDEGGDGGCGEGYGREHTGVGHVDAPRRARWGLWWALPRASSHEVLREVTGLFMIRVRVE